MEFVMEMISVTYRGIELGTDTWRYGSLLRLKNSGKFEFYIVDEKSKRYKIYPASVGIGSGEKDIHGNEMFVGDIVRQTIVNERGEEKSWDLLVSYNWGTLWLGSTTLGSVVTQVNKPRLEIIGNRVAL